ncbi:transcriptional activator NhaR [Candidatus Methylomicrobium oryzae]|uniref:transcriptional activator NhaR n=1 Tax=Candidatus Methylomicrobium oryzae TaxID=2802053 RepID=UPI0019210920|nr:transcriptional activator NhaR [Methylomicrobium sp. RS1]
MSRLNYQHLFYFWNVVKEGSISRASEKLHLAQPTVSGQLAIFEQAVGEKLYYKDGRKLVLSDTGRTIFRYAEEIFTLGQELNQTLRGRSGGRGLRLNVGVADALPKLIAYRLLEPALRANEPVQLTCHEDKAERLIAELALHSVDLVLSDIPATPSVGIRVFNHLLGECEVAVFGVEELAERYTENFPYSLNGAPLLVPTQNTALRRSLDQWFDTEGICPDIKAEIEDSALLKTFAIAGVGMFVAPVAIEAELQRQYNAQKIGRIDHVFERFYAITAQRKLKHPAVMAILENASRGLFV